MGAVRRVSVLVAGAVVSMALLAPSPASAGGDNHPGPGWGWGPRSENQVYCLSAFPFRILVTYHDDGWGFGYDHVPFVIVWGDGTATQLPTQRPKHPFDPDHAFQVSHTYADSFNVGNHVLTDNLHFRDPWWAYPLRQLLASCPPPAQTPEVPWAILLPVSGLAIVGFEVWRRQRHASRALPA